MPPRDVDLFTRGGTPRLRQFIEECASGAPRRAQAAKDIDLTPAELSNFASGTRVPTPQKVLNIVSKLEPEDFPGRLDVTLIESGHAPTFFRHILLADKKMLLLKPDQNHFYSIEVTPLSDDLLAAFTDLRFASRKATIQVARIDDEQCGTCFVIETAYDDTDLADGEIALCELQGQFHFARIERGAARTRLARIDPFTLKEVQHDSRKSHAGTNEIGILGRVVLRFSSLCAPAAKRSHVVDVKRVRNLDKLRIGLAPFQDSLLTMVGVELGFFEEEGLLVLPERTGWYEWPDFLLKGKEDIPCIVFSNIFTFVERFTFTHDVRFLYGVNVFDRGFRLVEKLVEGGRREPAGPLILGDNEATVEIATIGNSDWAAQLFTFCQNKDINLAYESARGITHIYPSKPKRGRPTIVILDTTRQAGVENNPASINRNYSVYLGSIPQRVRLVNEYKWSTIEDVHFGPPFPVNGFVGSSRMVTDTSHLDVFLRFLRAWFRIINYVRPEFERIVPEKPVADAQTGSRIVERAFSDAIFPDQIAKLEINADRNSPRNEVVAAWQEESFPCNPNEIEQEILGKTADSSAWRRDARRAMEFIKAFTLEDHKRNSRWTPLQNQLDETTIPSAEDPFALEYIHREYVSRYGRGEFARTAEQLTQPPLPELLSVLKG